MNIKEKQNVPENVKQHAEMARDLLLPSKSRIHYEQAYKEYRGWYMKNKIERTKEESILAYFNTDLASYKSSSLWTKYSMLRSTINLSEGIDISKFLSVIPYLKKERRWLQGQKSKENVDKFLTEADNKEHLLNKLIIIFGVAGACRRLELASLTITCFEDCKTHFLVKLIDTKVKKDRSFIIVPGENENINLLDFDPQTQVIIDFFINYVKLKCTSQPVEIVPLYTGHCFRRTSASILADAGAATLDDIKRHGGWRSSTVAAGYVDDSESSKISVANRILGEGTSAAGLGTFVEIDKKNNQTYWGNNKNNEQKFSGINIHNNSDCVIDVHFHS